MIDDYEDDLRNHVFDGDLHGNRASYDDFKEYIDLKTKFEEGPDQYEKDMGIFDDDHNGKAGVQDVKRVMKDLAGMSDADISLFIKKCIFPNLNEAQIAAPLESLDIPESFSIKKSSAHLYNI